MTTLKVRAHGLVSVNPNSTDRGWISLIDDLYTTANALILRHKLNVEFVLDGGATPDGKPCLKDKWRPWNSTWIKCARALYFCVTA